MRKDKEETQAAAKNQVFTVKIEDIGVNGEGIGKVNGYILFIKDAVIGDLVEAKVMKAKKSYGYARLLRVLKPSGYRTETAVCPIARACGGCQIQEMKYERQLQFKETKVRENLLRIGGLPEALLDAAMEPVFGMEDPWHYRNKAQFPVGTDKNGRPVCGFYAGRTHDIIANTDCALGAKINEKILQCILGFMEEFHIRAYDEKAHQGLVRHILLRCGFYTKEIMVCLVINGNTLPHAEILTERLRTIEGMTGVAVSVNREKTNVILGSRIRTLWGKPYITDRIGDITYRISPLSFYQVNPVQTEKLYQTALEYAGLTGKETVWDLYCGIGTISLFLAKAAKQVYGVEIVRQAVEDARINAKLNGIKNAEFYTGKAEEVLPAYYKKYEEEHGGEKARADVIVVDPPRKGCDAVLLRTIADMAPDRIVYVSCNPATLARDMKFLRENGYEAEKVRPVDMFPHTVHVETVVLLSKLNTKQHIEVELDLDELDLTAAESKATYNEIKAYVLEKYGLKVSSLYISQVKRKCGLDVGPNYNLPKKEDARVPQCPPEKEAAIVEALKAKSPHDITNVI